MMIDHYWCICEHCTNYFFLFFFQADQFLRDRQVSRDDGMLYTKKNWTCSVNDVEWYLNVFGTMFLHPCLRCQFIDDDDDVVFYVPDKPKTLANSPVSNITALADDMMALFELLAMDVRCHVLRFVPDHTMVCMVIYEKHVYVMPGAFHVGKKSNSDKLADGITQMAAMFCGSGNLEKSDHYQHLNDLCYLGKTKAWMRRFHVELPPTRRKLSYEGALGLHSLTQEEHDFGLDAPHYTDDNDWWMCASFQPHILSYEEACDLCFHDDDTPSEQQQQQEIIAFGTKDAPILIDDDDDDDEKYLNNFLSRLCDAALESEPKRIKV